MKGVCILIAITLLAAAPIMLWPAENGAALYESMCSMCHGAKGEGNPDAVPALKTTKMTAEKIIVFLTKGEKDKTIHASQFGEIKDDQAKAIAEYVKKMK
jgi:cytochrome c553